MPKLWNETIEAHRSAVRDATLDATETVVAERGLRSITMSEIAERAGIGRATLYKYFPDVEAIINAWHERKISRHLARLAEVRDQIEGAGERLEAVLSSYIQMLRHTRNHHHNEPAAVLHQSPEAGRAHDDLHAMLRDLIVDAARAGLVRDDISAEELAVYCMSAASAAPSLRSEAAVLRLVEVTLAGMRPVGQSHGP
jgi:AcrR family transcriptional regulator